jgi:hypothetical protein
MNDEEKTEQTNSATLLKKWLNLGIKKTLKKSKKKSR